MATVRRWHLRTGEDLDLSPSQHIPEPEIVLEPAPEVGPVLVEISYRIQDEQQDTFVEAMEEVRLIRLRDGAFRWELFCDPAEPGRYVETYEVASWAEHLRQRERATVADLEVESRALACQEEGTAPVIAHLISARSMRVSSDA
jgi:quinol monooxygenase YgiN